MQAHLQESAGASLMLFCVFASCVKWGMWAGARRWARPFGRAIASSSPRTPASLRFCLPPPWPLALCRCLSHREHRRLSRGHALRSRAGLSTLTCRDVAQRRTLYELYHKLNHYNLFGGGYYNDV